MTLEGKKKRISVWLVERSDSTQLIEPWLNFTRCTAVGESTPPTPPPPPSEWLTDWMKIFIGFLCRIRVSRLIFLFRITRVLMEVRKRVSLHVISWRMEWFFLCCCCCVCAVAFCTIQFPLISFLKKSYQFPEPLELNDKWCRCSRRPGIWNQAQHQQQTEEEEEKEKNLCICLSRRRDGNVYKSYTSISIGV